MGKPDFRSVRNGLLPVLLLGILACGGILHGADYHVDPNAGAGGDGSAERPFADVPAALEKLQPGDRCMLHPGTYRQTIVPPRGGTAEAPIVIAAAAPNAKAGPAVGGQPVRISGCEVIGGWRKDGPGLFSASVELPDHWDNQVFVDGKMLWLARWPNAPQGALLEFPTATMDKGSARGVIVDKDLPDRDWSGGRVWASSHKRWYSWTAPILKHEAGKLTVKDTTDTKGNHVPREKGLYAIIGAEACFDAPWEWFYHADRKRLVIRLPEELTEPGAVEVKRRALAVDLRGKSYVHLRGIEIHAATVVTDDGSEGCVLDRLKVLHPTHSWLAEQAYGSQRGTGVVLRGRGHRVTNSEIAYSSGDGISVRATDCEIVNCYIHDTDYIGSYASAIGLDHIVLPDGKTAVPSRRNLISHCTLRRTGRSLIGLSSFYDSVIQFCDLGEVGYLTWDLGLVYGNCISGGGSEFRYNHLHDVKNNHLGMGLYYDHGCQNILSHHNLIWNVNYSGLQHNQYALFLLWYRNTAVGGQNGYASAWAAAQLQQAYGCRLEQNAFEKGPRIKAKDAPPVYDDNHLGTIPRVDGRPGPAPGKPKRTIEGLIGPCDSAHYGALDPAHPWVVGHDFERAPEVERRRSKVRFRNRLLNAAFESGAREPWTTQGEVRWIYEARNSSQWVTDGLGRMGRRSVALPSGASIAQAVTDVEAGAAHRLIAHLRAEDEKAACLLRVAGPGEAVLAERRVALTKTWTPVLLDLPADAAAKAPWTVRFTAAEGTVLLDDTGLSVVE